MKATKNNPETQEQIGGIIRFVTTLEVEEENGPLTTKHDNREVRKENENMYLQSSSTRKQCGWKPAKDGASTILTAPNQAIEMEGDKK